MFSSTLSVMRQFCRRAPRRAPRSLLLRVEQLEDRIALNHAPLGPEFQGNEKPFDYFLAPQVAVASDPAGNFVVAWSESNGEGGVSVKARCFDRDGNPQVNDQGVLSDIVVASGLQTPFNGVITVDVAMTSKGDFVVVYDRAGLEGFGSTVMAHYYASNSVDKGEIEASPFFGEGFPRASQPSAALDDAGDLIVTYVSGASYQESGFVEASQIDAARNVTFVDFGTDTPTISRPAIDADGRGDFVIAWNSQSGESAPHIVFQQFTADLKAVDTAPVEVSAAGFGGVPSVGVAHDTGAFVLSWTDFSSETPAVEAQRFDAAGTALAPIFQVNTDQLTRLASTSIAVDDVGDFAVVWATGPSFSELPASVFARTYSANGSTESAAFKVNEVSFDAGPVDVAVDATLHQFVVNWSARGTVDDSTPLTVARIYRLPPPPHVDPPPMPVTPPAPAMPPPLDDTVDPAPFSSLKEERPRTHTEAFPFVFIENKEQRTEQLDRVFFAPHVSSPETPFFLLSGSQRDQRMGEISGRVFLDLNGNGIQDEGEPGLEGVRVFLDMNNNGIQDETEPAIDTDAQGRYVFTGLALDHYRVRQVVSSPRISQTSPDRNTGHEVQLSWENNSVAGRDFGAKMMPLPPAGAPVPPAESTPIEPPPE